MLLLWYAQLDMHAHALPGTTGVASSHGRLLANTPNWWTNLLFSTHLILKFISKKCDIRPKWSGVGTYSSFYCLAYPSLFFPQGIIRRSATCSSAVLSERKLSATWISGNISCRFHNHAHSRLHLTTTGPT